PQKRTGLFDVQWSFRLRSVRAEEDLPIEIGPPHGQESGWRQISEPLFGRQLRGHTGLPLDIAQLLLELLEDRFGFGTPPVISEVAPRLGRSGPDDAASHRPSINETQAAILAPLHDRQRHVLIGQTATDDERLAAV